LLSDNRHRIEWMKEALRRSGSALWLYCCDWYEYIGNGMIPSSFFFGTLAEHWERAEMVAGKIYTDD